MRLEGSVRFGRIAGIDLRLHVTWLLAFGLLTWSLASSVFPATYPRWSGGTYWLVGALAALLLFACVLVHELSHALVARARGMRVAHITLFVFGGVTSVEGEAEEPADEFWMAVVGPLTSLALACLTYALYRALGGGRTPLAAVLSYLAYVNLALALFNLVPGFPLDGGRVLRSALWGYLGDLARATRIAARIGQAVAYLFIAIGIVLGVQGEWLDGVWIALIGVFLLSAAVASYHQAAPARRATVRTIMHAPPVVVPADLSVAELVARDVLGPGGQAVMVGDRGRIVGLVTLSDARRVSPAYWSITPLHAIMTPAASLTCVAPESSLEEALARCAARDVSQLPVVQAGALVGLLRRADALRYLHATRGPAGAGDESLAACHAPPRPTSHP